jgi:hypothetical protein
MIALRYDLRASEAVGLRRRMDSSRASYEFAGPNRSPSVHPLSWSEMRALHRLQRESAARLFVFVSKPPFTTAGFARMTTPRFTGICRAQQLFKIRYATSSWPPPVSSGYGPDWGGMRHPVIAPALYVAIPSAVLTAFRLSPTRRFLLPVIRYCTSSR